jgi:hypothetical protein
VKTKDDREYSNRLATHFPEECAFEPMIPLQTQFQLQHYNLEDSVVPNEE